MNNNERTKLPKSLRVKSSRLRAKQDGLFFQAVPSNSVVSLALQSSANPQIVWPGRTVFTDKMKTSLSRCTKNFWYPNTDDISLPRSHWVVNGLAEADRYPHALKYLAGQVEETGVAVFNSPQAVLDSRRDRSAQRLNGIVNLIVPQTRRFRPTHTDQFKQVFASGGFEFPVLIRPAGTHTGKSLIKIDGPGDWDKIHVIPWGGTRVYMTQWMDFRSSAGEWRKLRLSITPQAIRLRHILYGTDWLIHSVQRSLDEVEREMEVLLNADDWEAMQQLGADIRDRVGLDFFGVDLGWKSDSEFVLFEANASMSILSYHNMPESRRADYVGNLKKIEKDVWRSLEGVCKRTLV